MFVHNFGEFHDETGQLTFDDFEQRIKQIHHLPVYNLDRDPTDVDWRDSGNCWPGDWLR